ncbi:THAP domain-containing protein 6-like [Phycodurus eques]|uniref:THAP domain-containing protein 6-like n=1 Tax=Phycodurus eques TaxID=693459 RepID=UPI002ACD5FDC|nr:THAP domain-containing protein 6-like [Phycodurus eques]
MPAHCAAYGCTRRRTAETRDAGITFHKFPRGDEIRRQWEKALRRKDFTATDETVLCSQHFMKDDFDRTGQICRIRVGVIPSVFNFPDRPRKVERKRTPRTTRTSMKAQEGLPLPSPHKATKKEFQLNSDLPEAERTTTTSRKGNSLPLPTPQKVTKKKHQLNIDLDHNYSLPSSPAALKVKFSQAATRIWNLEKEKRNALVRERRAMKSLIAVLHKPLCKSCV